METWWEHVFMYRSAGLVFCLHTQVEFAVQENVTGAPRELEHVEGEVVGRSQSVGHHLHRLVSGVRTAARKQENTADTSHAASSTVSSVFDSSLNSLQVSAESLGPFPSNGLECIWSYIWCLCRFLYLACLLCCNGMLWFFVFPDKLWYSLCFCTWKSTTKKRLKIWRVHTLSYMCRRGIRPKAHTKSSSKNSKLNEQNYNKK